MNPAPFSYQPNRTIQDADGVPLARCYAGRGEDEHGPLFAASPALLAAAERVFAGLNKRIDEAVAGGGSSVPVFDGIAELSDAINAAKAGAA